MPFDWGLPPAASTFAGDIDRIYYLILVVTGLAFVIVEVALLWFAIRYRGRPGRKAHYTHGSARAEVIWTAVPAVVVVVIGILSGRVWNHIRGRDSVPPGALPVQVTAKQFEWNVTYSGADGEFGTADDFTRRNELRVPVNRPVVVHLGSEDVIHSFFVPAFRVKQDAVPGMHIRVWFEATQTGEFPLACAELCGLGHYRMGARVVVQTLDEYERWLAEQGAGPTVASR
jgi:cytochrome c oxidase subunit 2